MYVYHRSAVRPVVGLGLAVSVSVLWRCPRRSHSCSTINPAIKTSIKRLIFRLYYFMMSLHFRFWFFFWLLIPSPRPKTAISSMLFSIKHRLPVLLLSLLSVSFFASLSSSLHRWLLNAWRTWTFGILLWFFWLQCIFFPGLTLTLYFLLVGQPVHLLLCFYLVHINFTKEEKKYETTTTTTMKGRRIQPFRRRATRTRPQ